MQQWIDSFLKHVRFERNYSPHTVCSYQHDLKAFHAFLSRCRRDEVISPVEIDHLSIRAFLGHLHQGGKQRSTIARKLATLRSCFRFLHQEGVIQVNPARLVRTPRQDKSQPRFLSREEVEIVLGLPGNKTDGGIRDCAILEMLYATGMRIGELVGLNLEDVALRERLVKVRGKGKKERLVPFGENAAKALRSYLPVRKKLLRRSRRANHPNALFLNLQGGRITARSVQRNIRQYTRDAALALDVHPHLFRHSFATHLLNAGADLRSIQELLGHETLATTQKYTHLAIEQLIATYRSSHPRAKVVRSSPE